MGRPGTAAALSVDQLRQEWLSLRGELGIARSQLASTRQDKVSAFPPCLSPFSSHHLFVFCASAAGRDARGV
jgi:hypothetical protein